MKAETYWNRNLDPLNQREGLLADMDVRWQTAFRNFLGPDVRAALAGLGDIRGKRGLVPASGLGCESVYLARLGAIVTGVDIAAQRTELAQQMVRKHAPDVDIRFVTADAQCLPFNDASFDFVFSRDVLMYGDWRKMTDECARVLTPGGRAVFMEALADHPALTIFRRFGWAEAHLQFTRYLRFSDMQNLSPTMKRTDCRAFYFLSLAAFIFLLRWGRSGLYRIGVGLLNPLDTALFRWLPALQKRAWRAVAIYQKD